MRVCAETSGAFLLRFGGAVVAKKSRKVLTAWAKVM